MSVCTAYIDRIIDGPDGTGVVLLPPWGERLVWLTDARPDHDAATAFKGGHPMVFTVRMTPRGSTMDCAVLVGGESGPRTLRTSLEVGLALCETGIHGTMRGLGHVLGLRTVVPAS